MNADFLGLFTSLFLPAWGTFAIVVIWYMRTKAANRTADASIEDGKWKRVTDWNARLQEECEDCHRREAEARRERDEWRAEALKWQAVAEGLGQIRTAQAISDAEKRAAEREGE